MGSSREVLEGSAGGSAGVNAEAGGDVLPAGFRLGSYTIQSVLGCGGFGITYLARHADLDKLYAIKEHFPRQFACRDGRTVRPTLRSEQTYEWGLRFLEEGRKLAKFDHPAIVDVADIFEAHGTAYMVLKYEPGEDFGTWLKGLGRPPAQAELDRIVAPLLDAVGHIHAKGMLHRDIAPDNIRIRADGTPVLIDFGSARDDLRRQSQLMSAIVKYGYSPPEQYVTDSSFQGPWSDIYALGATFYRGVTGAPPIEAAERKIRDSNVSAVTAAKGQYRAPFLRAIDWALALELKQRPQDIASWRAALLEGAPQAGAGSYVRPEKPSRSKSRPRGAIRWGRVLSGIAVVATGILIGSLYWPSLVEFADSSYRSANTTKASLTTLEPERNREAENARLRADAAAARSREELSTKEAERLRTDAAEARKKDAERQREADRARGEADEARRREDLSRREAALRAENDRLAEQRRADDLQRAREREARLREEERLQTEAANSPIQPSFDCATNTGPSELAVCGDRGLAKLDVDMDALYQNLRRLSPSELLRDEQRKWLKARDACGFDTNCLRSLYVARVQRLRDWR